MRQVFWRNVGGHVGTGFAWMDYRTIPPTEVSPIPIDCWEISLRQYRNFSEGRSKADPGEESHAKKQDPE